jgi:hypothetical protein
MQKKYTQRIQVSAHKKADRFAEKERTKNQIYSQCDVRIYFDEDRTNSRYYAQIRIHPKARHIDSLEYTKQQTDTKAPYELPLNGPGKNKTRKKVAHFLKSQGLENIIIINIEEADKLQKYLKNKII